MRRTRTAWRLWRWPLAFGVASAAGLASALLGDGAWDAASWIALGAPVAACAWLLRPRRS